MAKGNLVYPFSRALCKDCPAYWAAFSLLPLGKIPKVSASGPEKLAHV